MSSRTKLCLRISQVRIQSQRVPKMTIPSRIKRTQARQAFSTQHLKTEPCVTPQPHVGTPARLRAANIKWRGKMRQPQRAARGSGRPRAVRQSPRPGWQPAARSPRRPRLPGARRPSRRLRRAAGPAAPSRPRPRPRRLPAR